MTPVLPDIAILDDAPLGEVARLEALLDAHNVAVTGITEVRSLSILLKRPDGTLYAGLHGDCWGGVFALKLCWIDEAERGQGLGSAMMRAAEAEARARGCHMILLMTHSFQAPDFYLRHGFESIAAVAGNPIGHADIVMTKRLVE